MILLWGLLEDDTLRSVHDRLATVGVDFLFVNHAEIDSTDIRFSSKPKPNYILTYRGEEYAMDQFTSAYLRPYNFRDYAQFSNGQASSLKSRSADMFHHIIHSWAEHSSATIINKPSAEATNHSKLFQSIFIKESGFQIPDSLISNDHEEILRFHARHGAIIYKSMSSVRSIVKKFSPSDLDSRQNMGPAFFQEWIEGENIRVHVVGEKIFACRIESEGVDYRYAQSQITPCDIPEVIALKCLLLTKRLGLHVAGIDLIATKAGEWYCLEANPSPGFSYFDVAEGQPIAVAIAEILYRE